VWVFNMRIGKSSPKKIDTKKIVSIRECCSKVGEASFCSACGRPSSHTPKLYKTDKMISKELYVKGPKRCPKKGEYYLSGALPQAYEAFNDLSQEFHIAIPVELMSDKGIITDKINNIVAKLFSLSSTEEGFSPQAALLELKRVLGDDLSGLREHLDELNSTGDLLEGEASFVYEKLGISK